jgi:hypothetical protein
MNIDFQAVPEFTTGQPISAYDLNSLLHNNVTSKNILYSPQPLFMDSHAYAPKAMPMVWQSPEYDIWKGSFMYRSGMRYAYIGFHIKMDSGIEDLSSEFNLAQFTDISVAVIVKYTGSTYKEVYQSAGIKKHCAAVPLKTVATTTVTSTGGNYRFTIKNGHYDPTQTETLLGTQVITRGSRESSVRIDLDPLGLQDTEIVEIKLVLVTHSDPTLTANFGEGYTSFFNKFLWKAKLPAVRLANSHIFYSTLYAKVDGDLSYSANWPSTSFQTTGSGVLSAPNLKIITNKQKYITERLRNRPMPLTGSITYIGAFGGTSSVRLHQEDVVPGEWDYYTSNYWLPIDNRLSKLDKTQDQRKVIDMNKSLNAQSNLATFSWSPYFEEYNSIYLNFKFYGNTEARQAIFVDLPDQPVSQTSTRRSILYWPNAGGRLSYHILGNYSGQNLYGSVFTKHNTIAGVFNSGAPKAYLNKMYNVRIPSPTTPVYSPQFNVNTNNHTATYSKFYLTAGMWEDSVAIVFEKTAESGTTQKWGLAKSQVDNETIQYGFIGDASKADAMAGFVNKIVVNNTEDEADMQYTQVPTYNNSDYKWITKNGSKGYSQVFVNIYDNHSRTTQSKANYISYTQVLGMSAYNPDKRLYNPPIVYTPKTAISYSELCEDFSDINTDLDNLYQSMFINNPHFVQYDFFWGAPISVLSRAGLFKEYNDKFFFFAKQRVGNILIVRGKNVTMHYGEIDELKREDDPKGSLHPIGDVGITFAKTQSIISGDAEQTVVVHLNNIEELAYGQYYFLNGDSIVYASEFFEEPS